MIDEIINKIIPYIEKSYFNRFFNWFIRKLDLQDKAEKLDKKKNKGKHPIQPRKGDIKTGKLDKLPSKAKGDQLTCIDKARMLYKIGSVTDDFMQRLEKRIMKNLDIKIPKEKQEKKEIKNNENVNHEDINKKSENKEETNTENTNKKAQSEEVKTDKK